ncbi:MAG: DNA polymerase III subunit delta [Minisyncoccia bacterium]
MIYFLYGPDSYQRNEKLNSAIAEYRKKYPESDMASFDLREEPDNWVKAKDFLNQPSMFVDSKVLIIKESGAVPAAGGEKDWIKTLKSGLELPRTFIFISDASKPLKAFEFLTQSPSRDQFFGELEERELESFVKAEATVKKITFERNSLDFFLGYLSAARERSWIAVNELEKIRLMNPPQPVNLADLKKIIISGFKDEVFDVARSIMWSRTWMEKLKLLERLFIQKKEPAYVFNSLAVLAKGDELIKLADYDVSVKSGNLEYEEALLDFILP